MKVARYISLCVVTIALIGATSASADGMRNPPEGMTALGKIGGKIAYIDDASAVTHNPANLTDLTNASAIASVTIGYGKKEFTDQLGQKTESDDNWSWLPNIFAAIPVDDGLVAGVGLTTPYGRSTTFPEDSALRYSGSPYFTELYAINFNPSLAYKINDQISVAAGVDVLYSEIDFRQIYPWSMISGTPDGKSRITADGDGVGYNAAITWKISERQRAALTYRSPTKVKYEGDLQITGKPSPEPETSDFESEIEFPTVVAFGYGIQVNDRLRVEANVEWIEHSLFDTLEVDGDFNTAYLANPSTGSADIEADWDDNFTYGIGADYVLNDQWVLRAGFIYLETPIPSRTMLPTIAEEDQSVISIGFGYRNGNHRIDAAYALGLFNGRDVSNNNNPAFNGEYDFEAHLVGISYGLDL